MNKTKKQRRKEKQMKISAKKHRKLLEKKENSINSHYLIPRKFPNRNHYCNRKLSQKERIANVLFAIKLNYYSPDWIKWRFK